MQRDGPLWRKPARGSSAAGPRPKQGGRPLRTGPPIQPQGPDQFRLPKSCSIIMNMLRKFR